MTLELGNVSATSCGTRAAVTVSGSSAVTPSDCCALAMRGESASPAQTSAGRRRPMGRPKSAGRGVSRLTCMVRSPLTPLPREVDLRKRERQDERHAAARRSALRSARHQSAEVAARRKRAGAPHTRGVPHVAWPVSGLTGSSRRLPMRMHSGVGATAPRKSDAPAYRCGGSTG